MDFGGQQWFAEVHYYFQMIIQKQTQTLALVTKYSDPDAEILRESFGTLWVLKKQQPSNKVLTVIEAKNIITVVPIPPLSGSDNLWFLAEKPGLNISEIGGVEELMEE